MFSLNQNPSATSTGTTALATPSATLSMEVSYPFHSHMIGRSGKNINRLMEESGTRIHFPDRNRISGQSKSNGVVVRGQLANLENARQRIRACIPVEFIIDCRNELLNSLGESSLADYFSRTFGVLLRFYPKIDGVNCQVNVRGQQDGIELLKQAVTYLGRITQTSVEQVVMKMETSFDHVWIIRPHIDKIVSESGTGIRCPDVSNLKELPKKYSIWVRGSMDSVLLASTMLHGLLPMQLMVQIPSDRLNSSLLTAAQEADVLFHVERSVVLDTLTIRLTSYEWNACNLFDLIGRCFDLPKREIVKPCLPPQWLELRNISRNILVTQKLLSELSSSHSSLPHSSGLVVEIPKCSPESSVTSTSFSSSQVSAAESSIPASLSASRFDPNSFRHLSELLETVGLSRYSDLFLSNEVDMAMFTTLTEQDLISIGISSFGARKIMLNAIQELRS